MKSEALLWGACFGAADALATARLLCCIAGLGACLSCAEWCHPWDKLARLAPLDTRPHARGGWRVFWHPHGTRALLLGRFVCALAAVISSLTGWLSPAWVGAPAMLAGTASLLLRADEPIGVQVALDGGEYLLMVCLLCVGAGLALGTSVALQAALVFVAFQALLEYASAGWIKLRAWRGWLDGTFLQRVVAASNYGHPALVAPLARHPRRAGLLSIAVIALELALPATPLLARPYAELVLAAALLFHVGTGAVMGLNSFVWGFGAAFPAILYCRDWLLS
jgi:hypothetical protein